MFQFLKYVFVLKGFDKEAEKWIAEDVLEALHWQKILINFKRNLKWRLARKETLKVLKRRTHSCILFPHFAFSLNKRQYLQVSDERFGEI